jgi:hypothetical protein
MQGPRRGNKLGHPDRIGAHIGSDIEYLVIRSHVVADQHKFLPVQDVVVHDPHTLIGIIIENVLPVIPDGVDDVFAFKHSDRFPSNKAGNGRQRMLFVIRGIH